MEYQSYPPPPSVLKIASAVDTTEPSFFIRCLSKLVRIVLPDQELCPVIHTEILWVCEQQHEVDQTFRIFIDKLIIHVFITSDFLKTI